MSKEIDIKQIKIEDNFWSEFQNRVIDTVIPFQEKVLNDEVEGVEKSHAIENFRIAAGLSEGEFYGFVFQDSDVAKWLEGVAYSLIVKPDKDLERRADAIIDIIEMAQQEDGYLDTYFIIKEPEHRWQNLQECHELYCAGHMMEAAAAYYEATGKDKLLKVMEKNADHIIDRFGDGKTSGYPGHQEVEIGLMKLYHLTGKEKYKNMANHFISERGKEPNYFEEEAANRGWFHWGAGPVNKKYFQAHDIVTKQTEAIGHAVRAVYMYTAMADLAKANNDEKLFEACDRLWDNIVQKKMYITGGIGNTFEGEAFTKEYELPNDMAYTETCASIGLVFFAKKMLNIKKSGKYAQIMERALYNGIISGISLDGKAYFYVNPLEAVPGVSGEIYGYQHDLPQRPGWHACACCPPNLVRMVTSLGKYLWEEDDDTIYSHMFVGQNASFEKADITVKSEYPNEGNVSYILEPKTDMEFTLAIHIPEYADNAVVSIIEKDNSDNKEEIKLAQYHNPYYGERNQTPLNLTTESGVIRKEDGYLYITRRWQSGDEVNISFEMDIKLIYSNPLVRANVGCVAIMRGPFVYCIEGVDNGDNIHALSIKTDSLSEAALYDCQGVLEGIKGIELKGSRLLESCELYFTDKPKKEDATIKAIPYYAWANRGLSSMRVWIHAE